MKKVLLLVMVLCLGLMVVPTKAAVYYELWDFVPPVGTGAAEVDANNDGTPDPALLAFDWVGVIAPNGNLDPIGDPIDPIGELNNFNVGASANTDDYMYRYIGLLSVATAGNYSFWGDGDDGVVIFVDGVLVANFDGLHGGEGEALPDPGFGKTVAPIALGVGPHLIEVFFYERGGGDFVEVRYAMSSNESDAVFIADADLSLPVIVDSPAAYAADVPLSGETLSWSNPLGASQFNVYFGTTPKVGDPNNNAAFLAATVDGTSVSLNDIAGGDLVDDTRYFVRVDTIAEPNNVVGAMFVFDSMRMAPIITGDPVSQTVGPGGCLAAFSVTATSGINDDGGDLSYQWYDDNGAIDGEIGDTLVTDAEGSYYCVVTNGWGDTTSASAILKINNAETLLYDFEGGGPGFTANGNAAVDSGSMLLTPALNSQSGSVIFDPMSTDPVADFRVSFDFNAGPSVGGADGLSFALMDAGVYNSTATFGESGPGGNSLSIGIDLYPNGGDIQAGGNYLDIRLNNVIVASAIPSFTMEGTGWHHVEISFSSGLLTLLLTPEGGVAETVFDAVAIDGFTPFVGLYGFGARTGGANNDHRVDNVIFGGADWKVTDPQYSPAQDDNDWIDPAVDLTLNWERAIEGPCGGEVTYDVIWTTDQDEANDPNAEIYVTVSDMQAVIAAADINNEDEIYWRVDVSYGGITQMGNVWYVEAIKLIPDIVSQPADTHGRPGETVSFTFEVTSQTEPVTYEWKKEGSEDVLGTDSTVEIVVDENSGGMYYCISTNPSGPVTSASARLVVERLVAYYPLDELGIDGEPNLVPDASGGGHHGEKFNGVSVVPGKIGNAFSFDGNYGDFIEVGTWNPSEGTDELSVAAWVNWTGTGNTWQGFIGKRDAWNASSNYWHVECSFNGDSIYFQSWNAGQLPVSGWSDYIDQWTHIIATFDGTTGIMYINGEPAVSGAFTFGAKPDSMMVIGSAEANGGNPWSGLIDDVKVYNYGLTPVEASSIYVADSGATGICSESPLYDQNDDCEVNFIDFAIFMEGWMECNLIPCDRW